MSALIIHASNRMEVLVAELAAAVKDPLARPLDKEVVVAQTLGMKRWVSLELARLLGICANFEFTLPKKFVHEILKKTVAVLPDEFVLEPSAWTWKITRLLSSCAHEKGFETLADYLREDHGLKRYQLSALIADIFDQYAIYRPDMVLGWESGKDDHWQARLWRECVKEKEKTGPHRAALWKEFLDKAQGSAMDSKNLPERVSIFGISALPPFYLDILSALSHWMEVHFFILNPCREYWADILSGHEMKRLEEKATGKKVSPGELHLTQGNALLASWGSYGRDFLDRLLEQNGIEEEKFVEPEGDTLLSHVQRHILNLRERGTEEEKTSISPDDRSIQAHSCHGPLREIEVLRDNLLDLFTADPSLTPGDVLVMAPDIEKYSPFIQAVFGAPEEDLRVPFSISDRNLRNESRIISAFFSILEIPGSRLGAARVLAILELEPVRQRFGLSGQDVDTVKRWVEETRIRWGEDAAHRKEMGLSEFSDNTWKAGMCRLLLGYAMEGRMEETFHGLLPYDEVEGSDTAVLGSLAEFLDALFKVAHSFTRKRTLPQWIGELQNLLRTFFAEDEESQRELRCIRAAMSHLQKEAVTSGFEETVDLAVIMAALEGRLKREISGAGFISGKATFCAMMPMRSIPFKVICLVGMDSGAFPRALGSHGFDLMARKPRPGDRSLGKEDRFIFLEAVISARQNLIISYVGQNIKDNSPSPPSILVSELLDYVDKGFQLSKDESLSKSLVGKHRLQAFHPDYFREESPLFSFSRENFEASLRLGKGGDSGGGPFISQGLSAPEEEWKVVDVVQLEKFFANPAKFLLNRRLGIYLEERTRNITEKEPFSLEGLERYGITRDLTARALAGEETGKFLSLARASGVLPHGAIGEETFERLRERIAAFVPVVQRYREGPPVEPLSVDMEISGFRLRGRMDNLRESGLLNYRVAKVKPKDRLTAWVRHVVLNAAARQGTSRTTIFVGEDAAVAYSPLEGSAEILKKLLRMYWNGLTQPLPFFPLSSWAFAETILKKEKSQEEALEKAKARWTGDEFQPMAEGEDPYFNLCFGKNDPFDSNFQQTAMDIFGPLFGCQEEEKL